MFGFIFHVIIFHKTPLPKYFGYFTLGEFKEIALKRKLKEPTKTSTTDHAEEEDYGREAKDHDQVFQCPKKGPHA